MLTTKDYIMTDIEKSYKNTKYRSHEQSPLYIDPHKTKSYLKYDL